MKSLRSAVMLISFCIILVFLSIPFMKVRDVAAAEVELSSAAIWPANHVMYKSLVDEWGAEIEKRTNGRVKIIGYPTGTLLTGKEIYEGVVNNIADIGVSVFAYTRGRFPLMEGTDLPFGYGSGLVATRVVNDIYRKYKPKEVTDTHVCFLHAHGPGIISTKKPVRSLDDISGMKIRCSGLAAKIVKKLGAVPVAMPQAATYEALQKGVVEGTASPVMVLETWKYWELVKYVVLNYSSSYTSSFYVVMNLKKWNSLPEDIQKVITEVSEEWIQRQGKLWDKVDESAFALLKEKGVEVIKQSPEESERWAKAVEPLINEYIRDKSAKGLPATEFIADIKELVKKYSK